MTMLMGKTVLVHRSRSDGQHRVRRRGAGDVPRCRGRARGVPAGSRRRDRRLRRQLSRSAACASSAADMTEPDDVPPSSQRSRREPVTSTLRSTPWHSPPAVALPACSTCRRLRSRWPSAPARTRSLRSRACSAGWPRRPVPAWSGLDFDSSRAWPVYNWMGPCKAALRSLNQYLARDLGPQGDPDRTWWPPARSPPGPPSGIPDFDQLLHTWASRSPLAWDPTDASAGRRRRLLPALRPGSRRHRRGAPRRRRRPRHRRRLRRRPPDRGLTDARHRHQQPHLPGRPRLRHRAGRRHLGHQPPTARRRSARSCPPTSSSPSASRAASPCATPRSPICGDRRSATLALGIVTPLIAFAVLRQHGPIRRARCRRRSPPTTARSRSSPSPPPPPPRSPRASSPESFLPALVVLLEVPGHRHRPAARPARRRGRPAGRLP